ncbi:MAG: hypothetical protein HYV40_01770 [Candidatus Levybacteria bacterium]|nr:hypothetical protein [Candidatus Levybacteria bacterium]
MFGGKSYIELVTGLEGLPVSQTVSYKQVKFVPPGEEEIRRFHFHRPNFPGHYSENAVMQGIVAARKIQRIFHRGAIEARIATSGGMVDIVTITEDQAAEAFQNAIWLWSHDLAGLYMLPIAEIAVQRVINDYRDEYFNDARGARKISPDRVLDSGFLNIHERKISGIWT